jgi:ribokinase
MVALGVPGIGDLVAWRAGPRPGIAAGALEADPAWADGDLLVPLSGDDPVDPTGAGDSFVAALTAAVLGGAGPEQVAWTASAAAGLVVARPGGRPELTPDRLAAAVRRLRGA